MSLLPLQKAKKGDWGPALKQVSKGKRCELDGAAVALLLGMLLIGQGDLFCDGSICGDRPKSQSASHTKYKGLKSLIHFVWGFFSYILNGDFSLIHFVWGFLSHTFCTRYGGFSHTFCMGIFPPKLIWLILDWFDSHESWVMTHLREFWLTWVMTHDSFTRALTHVSHDSWLILMSRDSDESWLMTHEYFIVPISIWVMIFHESDDLSGQIRVTSCEKTRFLKKLEKTL